MALALTDLMRWNRTATVAGRQVPLRGFVILALVSIPLLVPAVLSRSVDAVARQRCDWVEMGRFLSRTGSGRNGPGILFTYFVLGPEMAWRTPYDVVGAPYGNAASLRDTSAIFKATTDAAAKAVVDARGIGLVVICRHETENSLYRNGRDGSFLSRLEHGLAPGWLQAVPLPERLSGPFKLFRVVAAPPG